MPQADLEQLALAIKDLEGRLRAVRAGANLADKELSVMLQLELELLENIAILKTKEVITLAQEYKKAVSDLGKARLRLPYLRLNKRTYAKAVVDQENLLSELKRQYLSGLNATENNVIRGKFGRKDD